MRLQSALFLALVCTELGCSEHKVGRFNSLPEATITSHSDGAGVYEGETILLSGRVSDPDHSMEDLLVSWRVGVELICEELAPSDAGSTSCETLIALDSTEVILEVRDPESGAATDSIELDVEANQPPTADILSPTSATDCFSNEPVDFEALVSDVEDQAEDLILSWSSDIDGELDTGSSPDGTGNAVGLAYLTEGEHRITLTVTDTMGKTVTETELVEVGPPNSDPECSISSPFDGAISELGEELTLQGVAWDPDTDDLTSLSATWRSDLSGLLGSTTPDESGALGLTVNTLSRGTHTITLTVGDTGDGSCTDTVEVIIASPPEVSISSPADGELFEEDTAIELSGLVSDGDQDPETLSLQWSSDIDGVLATDAADTAGITSLSIESFSRGTHTLTLSASDDHEMSSEAEVMVTVNGLPSAPQISLSPDPAETSDDLQVTVDVESTDPEGDPVSYIYTWSRDGTATADTSAVISSGDTARGEVWEVTVTPDDGIHSGPSATASLTVDNTPPEIVSLSLTPLALYTDDSLTVTVTTDDADGDAVSLSYQWTVDGIPVAETGDTLDGATWFERDQIIEVSVTPSDGTDDGDSMKDSITVLNSTPVASAVDISPTELFTDDEAQAVVTGGDDDDDGVSYTYAWYVDGALVAETGSSLSGADYFDRDQTIYVVATPDDGTDSGTSVTSSSVTISNSPPELTAIDLAPDPLATDDPLVATPTATDADGDSISYTWKWTVSGTASSETTDTLDGRTEFDKGDVIIASAVPSDGDDDGDAFSSASITVGNTAPEITSVSLSPTVLYTDDTLIASVSTLDADGDSVSVTYLWEVDGVPVAETSDTLEGVDYFDRDQTVTVTVTPDDGSDGGGSDSDSVTVLNTAPEAASVTLSPTEIFTNDEVRAVVSGTDADGDGLSYSYDWYVDGALVAETSSTLEGSTYFDKDQLVHVVATPDDGTDTGSSATSSTLTVSNTPPEISDIDFSPEAPSTEDSLLATPTATDADGDSVSFTWEWSVSGAVVSETSDTLEGSTHFDKGDTIQVIATPSDGDDSGEPFSSDTLIVASAPPELVSGSLSPSVVYTDDTITAAVSTTDDDGDSVTVSYLWRVDGSLISPTTATLDGTTWFDKNQEVSLDVLMTDSTGETATETVGSVMISNTPPDSPSISLEPEEPRDGTDDLVCVIDISASDDDGDSISYQFSWAVDGVAWSGSTDTAVWSGDTIPGSETQSGEIWSCTATTDDGEETGGSDSVSVTITQGFGGWDSPVMSAADADYEASGEDTSDYAGFSVAGLGDIDGDGYDDIIIGGYGANELSTSTGMAFVLFGDSLAATRELDLSSADYRLIGENQNDYAGRVVSSAGDVDGDGLPDILVTAWGEDTNGSASGKSYLLYADELSTAADLYLYDADHQFYGASASDYSGSAAASAGDVDGDGCDDILFGAYGSDDNWSNAGAVYLWLCSSISDQEIQLEDADVILYGDDSGDQFGHAVAGGTDVDGDGYADILIGADGADGGGSNSGGAYLYSGASLTGSMYFASDAESVFVGEDASDLAGYTVAMPGDVDGDTLGDVLIGAYGNDSGGSGAGKSYLYFSGSLSSGGSFDADDSDHAFVGETASDSSSLGLAGAGDVDRDGLADILIGSPTNDTAGPNTGTAYLILSDSLPSSRTIDLSTADYAFTGEDSSDQLGRSVSGAGDVNGDSLDDFLMGAPYEDTAGSNAGAVYLWLSD